MAAGFAIHYGLTPELQTIEHGRVELAAAIDVTRAVYGRQRSSYETGEEALADTMFGFARAKDDFIELCVNGPEAVSITVALPIRAGWGIFGQSVRAERTVRSLGEAEEWLRRYFTLSHEDMRAALVA
jgi:hypothetical protein